jgi:predicted small metal-binding protein
LDGLRRRGQRFKIHIEIIEAVELYFCFGLPETGLNCDFVIKGDSREEFLRNGADHVLNQHGIDAKEIYWDKIPETFYVSLSAR